MAESNRTQEVKKTAVSEQKLHLEARDPFDEEKIGKVFDDYIRLHKPETTVAVALKAHRPEIRGEEVVIHVDNQLQLEHVDGIKLSLQNALMKGLNNGAVTLSFFLFDDRQHIQEEKKLITSQDKLEHFMKQNPAVAEMCRIFGLQLE